MYELLTIGGVGCLAAWIIMLFLKPKKTLNKELHTMAVIPTGPELPTELDPGELKRNLDFYSGDSSALQKYVTSLRQRFETSVGIKVIEQKIREANVRKELMDTVYEMLKSEGRLRRVSQEEELEDQRLRTQLLQEQAEQQDIEGKLDRGQELASLDHDYQTKKLRRKIDSLDKEQPQPDPIQEHEEKVRVDTAKKKTDIKAAHDLKNFERDLGKEDERHLSEQKRRKRFDLASYAPCEDEAEWRETVREKEGPGALAIFEEYQLFVDELEGRHEQ